MNNPPVKCLTLVPNGWPVQVKNVSVGLFVTCDTNKVWFHTGNKAYDMDGKYWTLPPDTIVQPVVCKWENE